MARQCPQAGAPGGGRPTARDQAGRRFSDVLALRPGTSVAFVIGQYHSLLSQIDGGPALIDREIKGLIERLPAPDAAAGMRWSIPHLLKPYQEQIKAQLAKHPASGEAAKDLNVVLGQ